MKTILFVCTGNTCRSPMTQALFIKYLKEFRPSINLEDYEVISAGIYTQDGFPASREAIEVMRNEGIDLSSHRSLKIREELINKADYIITMAINHQDYLRDKFPSRSRHIFNLRSLAGDPPGDIFDPFGAGMEAYQETVQQLKKLLPRAVEKIINQHGEVS